MVVPLIYASLYVVIASMSVPGRTNFGGSSRLSSSRFLQIHICVYVDINLSMRHEYSHTHPKVYSQCQRLLQETLSQARPLLI